MQSGHLQVFFWSAAQGRLMWISCGQIFRKKNMFSVSSCLFTPICAAAASVCSRSTRVLPLWTLYTLTRHILMIRNRNRRCGETCVSVLQVHDWRVLNSPNGCSQLSAAIINACKTREHRLSQSWTQPDFGWFILGWQLQNTLQISIPGEKSIEC